jgi:hypothetical protein
VSTSTVLGQELAYFRGMSTISQGNAVLPPQAIPKRKKNDNWKKTCLDNLENEGLRQYVDNLPMTDYYKMLSGDMAYIDVLDDDQDLAYSYIQEFKRDKLNLPTYLKHWDLMYPVVSKIVGEWAMQYDKLRFDTTDEISTNDYIRERTLRLNQYSEAVLQKELEKMMALAGMDIKTDFKSEEEYNEYQAQREQVLKDYFPDNIDKDMKKNFKTEAAQWAEKTWERDYERFRMHILEGLEARDILLVGKSARHYRIGYDYYFPEYWHPVEVFHSKESSITRLEDAEFVGRIKWYTVTELINNYGDILSESERISIYKAYFGQDYTEFATHSTSQQNTALLGEGYFDQMLVPFKGYSDHKLALEFEAATGIPQSQRTDLETGETRLSYSMPLENNIIGYGAQLSKRLRTDIDIRTDTIQTTEVYFKGSKKIGIITYRTESGTLSTTEVDEDLLSDVIQQYEIKRLRKVSLNEYGMLSEEDKENTIIWIDTPVGYKGLKIRVSGVGLSEDIYKVQELPYQIKGEKGNVFDIKLPVCGYIGNSFCKIIRPYQIAYNYFMNQTQGYLEKEIGAFFVIDVNAIPTEYFGLPEGDDALFAVRNLAKTTGLLPTDYSRNQLAQNGGLTFNPMVYQNATFTEPMMRNMQMAERYKWMAYETLGLTPQAMGSPSQYATNEGIQVGQKAYFAQTFNIDQILMENKRQNVEVHTTIAQYCQLNNKDANYIYMASNHELEFLQAIKDEHFSLRQIDVRSTYNPTKNMLFQQMKQSLIQNNTMGNDALATIELFMSDDFMELKEAAQRARIYAKSMQDEQMQHQKEMAQMELQQEQKFHDDEIRVKDDKNQATVKIAELTAQGRIGDNLNDANAYQLIQDSANNYLRQQEIDNKNNQELSKIQNDLALASQNFNTKVQELNLQQQEIDIEREKLNTMKYVADAKNRDSIINKN